MKAGFAWFDIVWNYQIIYKKYNLIMKLGLHKYYEILFVDTAKKIVNLLFSLKF